jgi:hypothetical protein
MDTLLNMPTQKRELKNKLGKVFCTLTYDAAKQCNYLTWEGYCSAEDVKTGLEAGLALLKGNTYPRMINDSRLSSGPWAAANDWIITNWTPRAYEQGLRQSAMIVSANVFSAMSAQQLQNSYNFAGVALHSFATPKEAIDWFEKR